MEKNNQKGRNDLEKYCWVLLEEAGIQFDYERAIELVPAFLFKGLNIEKTKKGLVEKKSSYKNIIYSPDFMGEDWVIETKGLRRPDFDLRWKLFKHLYRNKKIILLMPGNQAQVAVCVEIIKEWLNGKRDQRSYRRILQITKDFQQSAKKPSKSKSSKVKKG